jgi:NTE family protein
MGKEIENASNIGLALGGGGFLGAAHIGVLHALEEQGISPKYISGTSAGSLIGALYSFGKSWQDIQQATSDLKWLDVTQIKLSKFGLLSNKKLNNFIDDVIGDVTFSDAKVPLAMVATDISNGERVVLSEGKVGTAIMASSCIPGVFEPVEIDDVLLVDGGLAENVPVSLLTDMGADFTIGVDLSSMQAQKRPVNIVEVLINSLKFAKTTSTKLQIKNADLLIAPDLSSFNMFDNSQIDDLIEAGYKEAKSRL